MTWNRYDNAIVEKAISCLPAGQDALLPSPHNLIGKLGLLWGPPSFTEWDDQDYGNYGTSDAAEVLRGRYHEEIEIIGRCVGESAEAGQLEAFKGHSSAEPTWKNATRDYAEQLWLAYAGPVRLHHGRLFIIWPPEDYPIHLPIIHEYDLGQFLSAASEIADEMSKEVATTKVSLNNWKGIGVWGLALLGIGVAAMLFWLLGLGDR